MEKRLAGAVDAAVGFFRGHMAGILHFRTIFIFCSVTNFFARLIVDGLAVIFYTRNTEQNVHYLTNYTAFYKENKP